MQIILRTVVKFKYKFVLKKLSDKKAKMKSKQKRES